MSLPSHLLKREKWTLLESRSIFVQLCSCVYLSTLSHAYTLLILCPQSLTLLNIYTEVECTRELKI